MDRLDYFARLVAEDPTVARARFGYANELLRAGPRRGRRGASCARTSTSPRTRATPGGAWPRRSPRLGRVDEAADAYLTGIDQSLKHGHTGMADEFRAALEAL